MEPLFSQLACDNGGSAGEKRDLLPDLVREFGGQGLDRGDRLEHDAVRAVFGAQRRRLRCQAQHLRAVVEVMVQLIGIEAVRDALRGRRVRRADLFGILRELMHVDDVGKRP